MFKHCFYYWLLLILNFCVCVCVLSCVQLFATPWTIACQFPLSMEFSRQEYFSGLSFPSWGLFPTQGLDPHLLHLLHRQVDSLPLSHWGSKYDYENSNFFLIYFLAVQHLSFLTRDQTHDLCIGNLDS